jgi:hypothetical protein
MARRSDDTLNEHDRDMENNVRGEKGRHEAESRPVGFFDSSLKDVRLEVLKKWAITTLILSTFILAVLSLYWGALFRVEKNMSSLVVWVVDFDGQVAPYTNVTPVVGPAIVQAALAQLKPTNTVGWGSLPASDFNYDPLEVRQRIYDYKAWAAIIINANATSLLQDAVQNGNASYDPMGAAQVVYVQARDQSTHYEYVTPQLMQFEQSVTSMFGQVSIKFSMIAINSTNCIADVGWSGP